MSYTLLFSYIIILLLLLFVLFNLFTYVIYTYYSLQYYNKINQLLAVINSASNRFFHNIKISLLKLIITVNVSPILKLFSKCYCRKIFCLRLLCTTFYILHEYSVAKLFLKST